MTRSSVSKRLVSFLWKLWYPILTRLTSGSSLVFLNYGYADESAIANVPALLPQDEANRACIQLYHRVAGAISLEGKNVLEVSCGHGGGADFVARYLKPAAIRGIDRNPQAISRCKRSHDAAALSFSCGNALDLRFPNDSFDAVLNVEASHCYPDVPRFFAEVMQVLRPGGHFLYADFRERDPDYSVLQRQIRDAGFQIISQADISSNVVRGMQLNTEKYMRLIRQLLPRFLWIPATQFAGVKGSLIYRELESGKTIYFAFVLQKPAV